MNLFCLKMVNAMHLQYNLKRNIRKTIHTRKIAGGGFLVTLRMMKTYIYIMIMFQALIVHIHVLTYCEMKGKGSYMLFNKEAYRAISNHPSIYEDMNKDY